MAPLVISNRIVEPVNKGPEKYIVMGFMVQKAYDYQLRHS